jgi:hypothetical protein
VRGITDPTRIQADPGVTGGYVRRPAAGRDEGDFPGAVLSFTGTGREIQHGAR